MEIITIILLGSTGSIEHIGASATYSLGGNLLHVVMRFLFGGSSEMT